MSLLVSVLEPFTGGPASLHRLQEKLDALAQHTRDENRISALFTDLEAYISRALLEPGYLSSAAAHRRAEQLHRDLALLASDNPAFRADVAAFVRALQRSLERIASDRALGTLLGALEQLAAASEAWAECAAKVAVGAQGVWGDVVEWVVPRIGSLLRQLPLPRLEFASEDLDLAIDAPPFLSTSFVPDSIRFDTATSLLIAPFEPAHPNAFSSTSTLALAGLRMSTDNVGYHVKYKAFCLPFVESGLLDLHFGTASAGGLGATVDFATSTDAAAPPRKALFDVQTSQITLESFDVRPHASSHPVLMWLLRPLLRRVVRAQVEALLQDQLRAALELGSRVGWEVRDRARGGGWRGVLGALVDVAVNGYEDPSAEPAGDAALEEEEEEEEEPVPAATLHVSGKGITIDLEDAQVGVGEEGIVLPLGEAETPLPRPTVIEVVQEQSKDVVRDGARAADAIVTGAAELGEAVGEFGDEVAGERERAGWRSDAFDWSA